MASPGAESSVGAGSGRRDECTDRLTQVGMIPTRPVLLVDSMDTPEVVSFWSEGDAAEDWFASIRYVEIFPGVVVLCRREVRHELIRLGAYRSRQGPRKRGQTPGQYEIQSALTLLSESSNGLQSGPVGLHAVDEKLGLAGRRAPRSCGQHPWRPLNGRDPTEDDDVGRPGFPAARERSCVVGVSSSVFRAAADFDHPVLADAETIGAAALVRAVGG
ncbi:uncharacterized protein B0I36DRAFT_436749 [Microdochium trichocladiopsis]|uniref:Uncharacterized protein n=1 Tax=Microdochium trichocladiopsis TaxID=1682393 RepID=A0A9P8XSD0_9PEZI|nr:uncharacterized protein B0I36DRAFT_436749 [Microdochium trichocladiopsis]KAH7012080.1 hypothetical protein B0I36DRAFT_436749 [Microdochium trichocladiopsis]